MAHDDAVGSNQLSPLKRAEAFSRALAEVARRSRYSKRTKRRMASGGFAGRRGEELVRLFYIVSFTLLVLIPSALAAVYFGVFASDQYEAEIKFTVRGGESPKLDGIGMLTGLPSVAVMQDTQIVANYIQSRAMVDALNQRVALRRLFSHPDIDWFARFNPDDPVEKLVNYWKAKTSVSILMPSGIVVVRLTAFRAADVKAIGDAALEASEQLVNDMNDRMRRDTVAAAERELNRAAERLAKTRIEIERARNVEGVVDAAETARALNELVTAIESDRMQREQEYATQKKYVSEDAPQMRALQARINAAKKQLEELQARLTSRDATKGERPLSGSMTRFAAVSLENDIAQQHYASSAAALEMARVSAERKQVYLTTFVRPSLPEEARYPRRALYSLGISVAGLTLWGALCGAVTAIRNHMA